MTGDRDTAATGRDPGTGAAIPTGAACLPAPVAEAAGRGNRKLLSMLGAAALAVLVVIAGARRKR